MENQNNKANAFQHKRQPQDTNFQGQMKRVFAQFQNTVQGFTPPTLNCSRLLLNLRILLSYETKPRI